MFKNYKKKYIALQCEIKEYNTTNLRLHKELRELKTKLDKAERL